MTKTRAFRSALNDSLEVFNDPFYHNALPDYEWDVYGFRIYYYGSFFAYSYIPKHIAAVHPPTYIHCNMVARLSKYAPFAADLFADKKVCSEIEYLLTSGRKKLYSETYRALRK